MDRLPCSVFPWSSVPGGSDTCWRRLADRTQSWAEPLTLGSVILLSTDFLLFKKREKQKKKVKRKKNWPGKERPHKKERKGFFHDGFKRGRQGPVRMGGGLKTVDQRRMLSDRFEWQWDNQYDRMCWHRWEEKEEKEREKKIGKKAIEEHREKWACLRYLYIDTAIATQAQSPWAESEGYKRTACILTAPTPHWIGGP